MSRVLPPQPSLEHLRNQAKDLLRDWQQRTPGLQLADAQHAIANEYGFPSWPKLKAHIESLTAAEPRSGQPPETESPFVGTWLADMARSKRHPANEVQSATLQFAVAGDLVTITQSGINASGQEEHGRHTVHADGQEHPSGPAGGYVLIARWRGSRVIETVAKKAGDVVGGGTYEVSADGNTLTVSTKAPSANTDGWRSDFEQRIVFDRSDRARPDRGS